MGGGSLPPMPGSGLPTSLPGSGLPASLGPLGSSTAAGLPPQTGGGTALPSGGGLPPLPPAGAGGYAPLPGSGGLPPTPGGAAGTAASPGRPGEPPRGVFGGEMPVLGGKGAQQADPLEAVLQSIMKVMGELEQCTGQLRGRAAQLESLTLGREAKQALNDQQLEARFQQLVGKANKFSAAPPDAAFIAEAERFNKDLVAHSETLWSVCAQLGLEKSAVALPVQQRPALPTRADL